MRWLPASPASRSLFGEFNIDSSNINIDINIDININDNINDNDKTNDDIIVSSSLGLMFPPYR